MSARIVVIREAHVGTRKARLLEGLVPLRLGEQWATKSAIFSGPPSRQSTEDEVRQIARVGVLAQDKVTARLEQLVAVLQRPVDILRRVEDLQ